VKSEQEIRNKIDETEYLLGKENGDRYEEGYDEGFKRGLEWVLQEGKQV
jgi:hypothetical protein